MSELTQLIKMANQVAANFSFHEDAQTRLEDHLTRFWAPRMRQKLASYVAGDLPSNEDEEVLPIVAAALVSMGDVPAEASG